MLSNEDIYKSRDVSTAEMVAIMMELKYFDEQFMYYGCAYAQDGVVKYRLNENAKSLYRFWKNSEENGIYPTNIVKYVRLLKVPSGKENERSVQVQKEFAEKLKATYPLTLFRALNDLGAEPAFDAAEEILRDWQEELELCYDADKIELFAGAVKMSFDAKLLKKATFARFKHWIEERKELISNSDNVIWRDKRIFYGFMYWQDGQAKVYSNAEKVIVHEHRYELLCQKVFCTPIFAKGFWFDAEPVRKISGWRDIFEKYLFALMQDDYIEYLQQIRQLPAAVEKEKMDRWLEQIDGRQYPEALRVLNYYQMRWQLQEQF